MWSASPISGGAAQPRSHDRPGPPAPPTHRPAPSTSFGPMPSRLCALAHVGGSCRPAAGGPGEGIEPCQPEDHRFNSPDSTDMQPELKVEMGFVQRRLPWLVASGAFLIFLVTLNHSSTFAGISSLAKAGGWDWRSNVVAPVHVLVTTPVRWLPAGIQLLYLNLVAAASAAAALGLLARSVALLPHDRTREQRALER